MPARRKTVCLAEKEYENLVRARGKFEHETGQRTGGFGELIMFLAGLYLTGKLVESLNSHKRKRPKGK